MARQSGETGAWRGHVPAPVIRARTRQAARFLRGRGRLPADVTGTEATPRVPGVLVPAACGRQQARIERYETGPWRTLLRLRVPVRPGSRSYRNWSRVLRVHGRRFRVGAAFTHQVPAARRNGMRPAPGSGWGVNILLPAGAVQLREPGRSRHSGGCSVRGMQGAGRSPSDPPPREQPHARLDQYDRLIAERQDHPLTGRAAVLPGSASRRRAPPPAE